MTYSIYKLNLSLIVVIGFVLFIAVFRLNVQSFNIDELIITENLNSNFQDYMRTNSAYGVGLKVSHWVSENILWGGPSAWRILSVLSLFCIGFLGYVVLREYDQLWLWVLWLIWLCMSSQSIQYARWGMTGYMLSSALLCFAFYLFWSWHIRQSYPNLLILSFGVTLLSLLVSFAYLGETVALIALIISFGLWELKANKGKGWRYWVLIWALTIPIICASTLLMVWINGGIEEPRTSIQHLYFPFNESLSLLQFSISGVTAIFKQLIAPANYISSLSLLTFIGAVIFTWFVVPVRFPDSMKNIAAIMTLWLFFMILGIWMLGAIGKAPFGDVRYIKALVWLAPLWLLCSVGLILGYCRNALLTFFNLSTQGKPYFFYIWFMMVVLLIGSVAKDTWAWRNADAARLAETEEAFRWQADLILTDELHKFSFEYLTGNKTYETMSRIYVCEEGRFWNAYGWNDCSKMKTQPPASFADRLADATTLLVISRGAFDAKNYQHWFKVVTSQGFEFVQLKNYGGPYVSLWRKSAVK